MADTDEHHIVHVLYSLQKQGLVEYKKKKSVDAPGMNVTKITLTPKGREVLERLRGSV